jgi:uncharacterized membrane protein
MGDEMDNKILAALADLVRDFRRVPKVVLVIGILVSLTGIVRGVFSLQNRPLMIGCGFIAIAIAGDYWPDVRYSVFANDYRETFTNWPKLILALLFTVVCIAAWYFAYKAAPGTSVSV